MIEKSLERQWKGKVLYKRRETTERYISISSPAITIGILIELSKCSIYYLTEHTSAVIDLATGDL